MKHLDNEQQLPVGQAGEIAARKFLEESGFRITATNYRKPFGEIDIIAKKHGAIHFVEVKTSKYYTNSAFLPEIRINRRKINALRKVCKTYLLEKDIPHKQWQIDVISCIIRNDGSLQELHHHQNAISDR